MKSEEQIQVEADYAYWKVFADAVGWHVLGFTFRDSATFTGRGYQTITLPGWARDDIMNVIKLREL